MGFDTNGKPFSGLDDTDKSDFHARLAMVRAQAPEA